MAGASALRVLVIEDEALLVMQLESFLEESGHTVVGSAVSSSEAFKMGKETGANLALVDVHLTDGPTGVEVGQYLAQSLGMAVVFMTANPRRIPNDFVGAIGVIAKGGCDIGAVGYQMTLLVERAGSLLTPALVAELRQEVLRT